MIEDEKIEGKIIGYIFQPERSGVLTRRLECWWMVRLVEGGDPTDLKRQPMFLFKQVEKTALLDLQEAIIVGRTQRENAGITISLPEVAEEINRLVQDF